MRGEALREERTAVRMRAMSMPAPKKESGSGSLSMGG